MTAAGSWYEIFIKKYWAEYIRRTHLLIPMLQSETPGISLVYTIHTSEDSPSTEWIALLAEVWRITCKMPSAALTHRTPCQLLLHLLRQISRAEIVCQGLSPFQLLHIQIFQISSIKEYLKPQKTYIACRIASWDKSLPHPAPGPYFSALLMTNSVKPSVNSFNGLYKNFHTILLDGALFIAKLAMIFQPKRG